MIRHRLVVVLIALGRIAYGLWDRTQLFLRHVAAMGRLAAETVVRVPLAVRNISIVTAQMFTIGISSVPLVTVVALFVGSVTVTQGVYQFSGFIPLRYLGLAVCKTLITELVPVITSMVVSGRISTAIAAEIGTMKTTEQLDAMALLGLDPVRYLVVPKTIACMIMLPVLVSWANLMAFVGSVITVVLSVPLTVETYFAGLRMFFHTRDLLIGVAKTSVFGATIALVGAFFGYQAKGGAAGIGSATTRSVLLASVLILIFDFVIAFVFLR